eukprot:CAMPEP_0183309578 /NCGR_PEP_ID=MMETSP0160_2-20130417/25427_1 /TAXON_ID=2839 ORGANISM="Odontella Sinensis, Strain Grunow 1884" /NCGR_SAMPLE_ID=MMETSP0160_2 /ASSEMBLY_ACC=CAM_ASM_000250 /LENGTH=262 /DNA_ID=CAMNT_0025473631 /DNA_START=173 /DNA_END=961 /DNA_ORIENTATION=-
MGDRTDKTANTEIEVEQKFVLANSGDVSSIEQKLVSLGFKRNGPEVTFTDWYFDLPAPVWALTLRDCWLRYREYTSGDQTSGVWQLKRGKNKEKSRATVYEEIEGSNAITVALSMLGAEENIESSTATGSAADDSNTEDDTFEFGEIPSLPSGCSLVPFARFETTRSGWTCSRGDESTFQGLSVDLDGTDFGFMVGEVEALVQHENDIPGAQKQIEDLTKIIISPCDIDKPAIGKLETYLIQRRPDHFEALVEAGLMKALTN